MRANIHNFINSVKNSLKNITDYHLNRGNMILKKSQEPDVADFQQAIIENDAIEVDKQLGLTVQYRRGWWEEGAD